METRQNGQAALDQTFALINRQREDLFAELARLTEDQLWQRPEPEAWSIGENVDHMRAVIASFLPFLQASWALFAPLARLRQGRAYRVEIDNVYHRPTFPQKVGFLFPSRYTPERPASLDMLRAGVEQIHEKTRAFYQGKDPDLLGQVTLWDPAIGRVNLIQALRVGAYHDELHIDAIHATLEAIGTPPGSLRPSAGAR